MNTGERVRAERRLAAILAADVVGYSRLIGADEEGTLQRIRAIRAEVIDPPAANSVTSWPSPISASVRYETIRSVPP